MIRTGIGVIVVMLMCWVSYHLGVMDGLQQTQHEVNSLSMLYEDVVVQLRKCR